MRQAIGGGILDSYSVFEARFTRWPCVEAPLQTHVPKIYIFEGVSRSREGIPAGDYWDYQDYQDRVRSKNYFGSSGLIDMQLHVQVLHKRRKKLSVGHIFQNSSLETTSVYKKTSRTGKRNHQYPMYIRYAFMCAPRESRDCKARASIWALL
jgi:hypothetical protein